MSLYKNIICCLVFLFICCSLDYVYASGGAYPVGICSLVGDAQNSIVDSCSFDIATHFEDGNSKITMDYLYTYNVSVSDGLLLCVPVVFSDKGTIQMVFVSDSSKVINNNLTFSFDIHRRSYDTKTGEVSGEVDYPTNTSHGCNLSPDGNAYFITSLFGDHVDSCGIPFYEFTSTSFNFGDFVDWLFSDLAESPKGGNTWNPDSASFDENIGTLRDIKFRYVTNSELNVSTYKITFSPITDKCFQLFDDGHDVEYYFLYTSKNDASSVTSDSFLLTDNAHTSESKYFNSLNAAQLCIDQNSFMTLYDDACHDMHPLADKVGSLYVNAVKAISNTWVGENFNLLTPPGQYIYNYFDTHVQIYLRPVDKNNNTYGYWSRISFDGNGDVTIDNGGLSEDGKPGPLTIIKDTSKDNMGDGVGNTWTSADVDADNKSEQAKNNSVSSSDAVTANAQTLIGMVKNIPILIVSLFSFLPSWCLTFVGVAFSLLVLIIVVKAVF